MLQVPHDIGERFEAAMQSASIAEHLRPHFRRWLRFYLDFCAKYGFDANIGSSFRRFNANTEIHCEAAYSYSSAADEPSGVGDQQFSPQSQRKPSLAEGSAPASNSDTKSDGDRDGNRSLSAPQSENAVTPTGVSWVWCYDKLEAAIKVRHYSPKTLQSYRSWIRNFQSFSFFAFLAKTATCTSLHTLRSSSYEKNPMPRSSFRPPRTTKPPLASGGRQPFDAVSIRASACRHRDADLRLHLRDLRDFRDLRASA